MKTLSFIVLFFALLGLSACGNRILVGEHIPKSIVTKTDFDNIKKNNVYNMKSLDDGTSGCDRMPRRTIRELKLTDRYYIRISGFYGPRPLFAYGPTTFTNIIDSYTCEQSADIKALDISNDRKYLAICVQNKGEERGVDILSIKDDLKIIDSKHIPCTDVKISPNNKWLSVQTEKYIYIYDLEKTGNLTFQSKYDGKISYDDSFIKLSPKEFIFLGDYLRTLVVSDSVKSEDKADDKVKILVGKDIPTKILHLKENPDKQIASFIKHTDCKRPRNSIFNLSGFSLEDKYCIEPFKNMILNLENFKKYIINNSSFVYNDKYIFACAYADDDKISKVEIFPLKDGLEVNNELEHIQCGRLQKIKNTKWLAIITYRWKKVYIYDLEKDKLVFSFSPNEEQSILQMSVSANHKWLKILTQDYFYVYNLENKELIFSKRMPTTFGKMEISENGRWLKDQKFDYVYIYDFEKNRSFYIHFNKFSKNGKTELKDLYDTEFSENSKWLSILGPYGFYVYNLENKELIFSKNATVKSLYSQMKISDNGKWLIIREYNRISIYDLESGKLVFEGLQDANTIELLSERLLSFDFLLLSNCVILSSKEFIFLGDKLERLIIDGGNFDNVGLNNIFELDMDDKKIRYSVYNDYREKEFSVSFDIQDLNSKDNTKESLNENSR